MGQAAVLVAAAGALLQGQAPVVNARVERRAVTQTLAAEVQAVAARGAASWIGYRIPMIQRTTGSPRPMDGFSGRCRLEPPTDLVVLVRVGGGAVVDLRIIPVDCAVDAAGMPLVWFDAVKPDESVAWLASFADAAPARGADRFVETAVNALALHTTDAAVPHLVRFAKDGPTPRTRSRALFWLAQRAADTAVTTIDAALARDPDTEVKKQAVFALSRLPAAEGVPKLIDLARTHQNVEVRRQAMFWLGQSKDPRAIEFFESVLRK